MRDIKYLVMDVDGTLTDGKIYMGAQGEVCKAFNIKDGYGLHDMAPKTDIIPVIITGRKSSIVDNRCKELGISMVFQGVSDKRAKLQEIIDGDKEDISSVAFIGDDNNDLSSMELVKNGGGITACPNDAAKEIVEISDYVCQKNGGEGAVREFIDWIINK